MVIIIIMVIKSALRGIIRAVKRLASWAEEETIYRAGAGEERNLISLWDYLSFTENTQAFHLISVIGFDEWSDMPEIRRRIMEIFGIEYKNEKSLYPYLKTLVDSCLLEKNSTGGKMQWRKRELLFETKREKGPDEPQKEKSKEKEKEKAKARA